MFILFLFPLLQKLFPGIYLTRTLLPATGLHSRPPPTVRARGGAGRWWGGIPGPLHDEKGAPFSPHLRASVLRE